MTKECQADLPQSFTLPNIPLKTNVQTCTMTRNDHIHVVSSCASSLINSLNYPLAINFDLACELDRESRCKLTITSFGSGEIHDNLYSQKCYAKYRLPEFALLLTFVYVVLRV